jgi:hypothetical protein
MEGVNQRGKSIMWNTPKVNWPTGPPKGGSLRKRRADAVKEEEGGRWGRVGQKDQMDRLG